MLHKIRAIALYSVLSFILCLLNVNAIIPFNSNFENVKCANCDYRLPLPLAGRNQLIPSQGYIPPYIYNGSQIERQISYREGKVNNFNLFFVIPKVCKLTPCQTTTTESAYKLIEPPPETNDTETSAKQSCPEHFIPSGDLCYYLRQQKVSFWTAFAECEALGSKLAHPRNNKEIKNIHALLRKARPKKYFYWWVGADYDVKRKAFVWTHNNQTVLKHKYKQLEPTIDLSKYCLALSHRYPEELVMVPKQCMLERGYIFCQVNVPSD